MTTISHHGMGAGAGVGAGAGTGGAVGAGAGAGTDGAGAGGDVTTIGSVGTGLTVNVPERPLTSTA